MDLNILIHLKSISNKRLPRKNSPSGTAGESKSLMNTEYIVILQKRINKFISEDEDLKNITVLADMYVGTIHGWCLKALQDNEYVFQKFSVLDEIKLKLFVDKNYKDIGMKDIVKLKDKKISMKIF